MRKLSQLQNIGKTIEKRLNQIGIFDEKDLRKTGAVTAYKKIKAKNPRVTIPVCYYLYSLEGALTDRHWDDLSETEKKMLRTKADNT